MTHGQVESQKVELPRNLLRRSAHCQESHSQPQRPRSGKDGKPGHKLVSEGGVHKWLPGTSSLPVWHQKIQMHCKALQNAGQGPAVSVCRPQAIVIAAGTSSSK